MENLRIIDLIERAPWREAITYRDTWPHEYVLSRKDNQRELIGTGPSRFRGRGGRCVQVLLQGQHLPVPRRPQVLAHDALGCDRSRRWSELRAEPGASLSGPARLRDSAWRYREAGGLPRQTRSSEARLTNGHAGAVTGWRYPAVVSATVRASYSNSRVIERAPARRAARLRSHAATPRRWKTLALRREPFWMPAVRSRRRCS